MAELAASIAAVGTAATAGTAGATAASVGSWLAGTTVTTAAGVTTALAPASGVLSALQGALTIGSMASSVFGGAMAYRSSQDQARFADLDAEGSRIAAEQKALEIRRQTVKQVGAARVAFGGSGLDISGAGAIEDSLASQAEYEIGIAQDAGAYGAATGAARAGAMRSRGLAGLANGIGNAIGSGLGYKIDIAKRG